VPRQQITLKDLKEMKMKKLFLLAAAIALLGAIVALSPAPALAQGGHYVVTNNDPAAAANSATIFKVENMGLTVDKVLQTGGNGGGGGDFAVTRVIIEGSGADQCLFVGDAGTSDIAGFTLPALTKTGNFTDPDGNSNAFFSSLGLTARGKLLFAAYGVSINIGVFEIEPGCVLKLLGTYATPFPGLGMRVTPNGKTLVVGYGSPVDSFSISSKGVLTENGPYNSIAGAGVDITSDGKLAIFGDITGGTTQVEIYPINPNGTLGAETSLGGDGSLGAGQDSSYVWLSPNEKFLYVSNNLSKEVTSLGFTESPLGLSYVGITTLADSGSIISIGGLTTASSSGNGGGIYVAEFSSPNGLVGLLKINSDGTTTEVSGSPYNNGESSALLSLAAFPQRPF
jgi:hypothetical protein